MKGVKGDTMKKSNNCLRHYQNVWVKSPPMPLDIPMAIGHQYPSIGA